MQYINQAQDHSSSSFFDLLIFPHSFPIVYSSLTVNYFPLELYIGRFNVDSSIYLLFSIYFNVSEVVSLLFRFYDKCINTLYANVIINQHIENGSKQSLYVPLMLLYPHPMLLDEALQLISSAAQSNAPSIQTKLTMENARFTVISNANDIYMQQKSSRSLNARIKQAMSIRTSQDATSNRKFIPSSPQRWVRSISEQSIVTPAAIAASLQYVTRSSMQRISMTIREIENEDIMNILIPPSQIIRLLGK